MSASTSRQHRARTAIMVQHIFRHNRTIDWLENRYPGDLAEPIIREMLFGTVRYLYGLEAVVSSCLEKPLREKDTDLMALMLVGAYQLYFMNVPPHAAINETVGACGILKKPWAKQLVNAILRRISNTEHSFVSKDQFPLWLRHAITTQIPEQAETLFDAFMTRAPMTLRINLSQTTPDLFRSKLDDAGIRYQEGPLPEWITLSDAVPAETLPGYADGLFAVQDGGAMWASHILLRDLETQPDSSNILDACAAPGGKFFHMLERRTGQAAITALEISPRRAETIELLARRLKHKISDPIKIQIGDARRRDWWNGKTYSHILLDAPCSGTGTIRRHPDIKVLLKSEDLLIAQQAQQRELLNNLWSMLQPGGSLLYCTCSILEQENDQVIETFVNEQKKGHSPGAPPIMRPLELPTGQRTPYGWQLLPTDPMTDGFYFSLLVKPNL